jgi:hypothetical protein
MATSMRIPKLPRGWVLMVACLALMAAHLPPQRGGFVEWVRAKVGLRRSAYNNLARVRALPIPGVGTTLIRFSLADSSEHVLADCGGCWSPLVLGDASLAFVKSDGIWVLSLTDRATRRVVPATELVQLVALRDGSPTELIVLQKLPGACAGDSVHVRVSDLATGRVAAPPPELDECVVAPEVVSVGRVRDGQVLATTAGFSGDVQQPRSIKVGWLQLATDTLLQYAPLNASLDGSPDGIDRFDPVWLGDTAVVYATRRLW